MTALYHRYSVICHECMSDSLPIYASATGVDADQLRASHQQATGHRPWVIDHTAMNQDQDEGADR